MPFSANIYIVLNVDMVLRLSTSLSPNVRVIPTVLTVVLIVLILVLTLFM